MPHRARRRPSLRDDPVRGLVFGGLTVFVAMVYVVVVLGGGAVIGHTASPDLGLSVLATAVVALAFEPVQARLARWSAHLARGGRGRSGEMSAYEVLSRFSETVAGSYPTDEVPHRMAQVLADGTGAQWAQVWLAVRDRLVLAATWPPAAAGPADDDPPAGDHADGDVPGRPDGSARPGRRALTVHRGGEALAVLRLQERDRQPLTPVEERLFAGLAAQAGLVLHGARLRAELAQRAVELSARAEELRLSRERLVDAQDAERRRLERDIHDGAQQHLVALAVNLRLAQTVATRDPERAGRVLAGQVDATAVAIDTLAALSRGIYPEVLERAGLAAALGAATANGPQRVDIEASGVRRYRNDVESAVYFCCLEALQNAAKHSGAERVAVRLHGGPRRLEFTVSDDGRGYDPAADGRAGGGLANMRDRIDAVGGALTVRRAEVGGTVVTGWVPVPPVRPRPER